MSEKRFSLHGAAYMAFIRDEQIFLIRRTNTHYKDGYWCLPGGHIEKDENPEESAAREGFEEAGVQTNPNEISFAYALFRRGYGGRELTYADYMFVAKNWDSEPYNAEPSKSSEGKWFSLNDLPEKMIDAQKEMLHNYSIGKTYSAYIEDET